MRVTIRTLNPANLVTMTLKDGGKHAYLATAATVNVLAHTTVREIVAIVQVNREDTPRNRARCTV